MTWNTSPKEPIETGHSGKSSLTPEQNQKLERILTNMTNTYQLMINLGHHVPDLQIPRTDTPGDKDIACVIEFSISDDELIVKANFTNEHLPHDEAIHLLERGEKAMMQSFIMLNHSGTKH